MGSQGKNTEVVCHSLLQWTTFCQISPPCVGDNRLGIFGLASLSRCVIVIWHINSSNVGLYQSGEGNGNPLQYSCLENSMDGGAWWAIVHGVAKSWTRLSDFTSLHFISLTLLTLSCFLKFFLPLLLLSLLFISLI